MVLLLGDGTMVTGWLKIGNDYYLMRGDGIYGEPAGVRWTVPGTTSRAAANV